MRLADRLAYLMLVIRSDCTATAGPATTPRQGSLMLEPTPELPDHTLISRLHFPTRIQNALSVAGLRAVGEVLPAKSLRAQATLRPGIPVLSRRL
jgi:hypothetical protein